MLQKGDLVWIPQETILLVKTPNNPQAVRIVKKPEVGLFVKEAEEDDNYYVVVVDGKQWVTNKKYIKRLRESYVSEVS